MIRFKQAEAAPRYAATLGDWDLSPATTDATFTFGQRAGVQKIVFLPVPAGTARADEVGKQAGWH